MPGVEADEILPCLWLGNSEAAESIDFLDANKISHVLSVLNQPIVIPKETVSHKRVILMDQPGEDLLGQLQDMLDFIEGGCSPGQSILVHCAMGVSRSSSVVIAYIMYKEKCTFKSAQQTVMQKHPQACPNDGFLEQLHLFEAMGCKCDPHNSQFKQHRLRQIADNIYSQEEFPKDLLASDPHNASREEKQDDSTYRCRKCRRALFLQSNVITHRNQEGQSTFGWNKQFKHTPKSKISVVTSQASTEPPQSCTSVFLEPVSWMESYMIGIIEGKISCPKCSSRLGSFNWSGQQCSCGVWMTPAFQVHMNRVDHMLPIT